MKHLSYRRLIEISKDTSCSSEKERSHIANCGFCADRLLSLNELDKRVKEISRIEPIFNEQDIGEMADMIFDSYSAGNKRRSFLFKPVPVFSLLLAVVFVVAVFSLFEFKRSEDGPEQFEELYGEKDITPEDTILAYVPDLKKEITLNAGKKLSTDRYDLEVLEKSLIVFETPEFVTVKKGELTFFVEGGGDFNVNLNDIALVRVVGTVFTVKVDSKGVSCNVSEGKVEFIDIERGESRFIEVNGSEKIDLNRQREKRSGRIADQNIGSFKTQEISAGDAVLSAEMERLFQYRGREDSNFDKPRTAPVRRYRFKSDPAMMEAEIRDLEFLLRFSNAPVAQLQQLFVLLSKRKHYGSIIHYWRVYSENIQSDANPFLHEMHRYACEASIKLFLYDNGICRRYRANYPDGPDPCGLNDHLDMAW